MTIFKGPAAQTIGLLLTRVIIPCWIFSGAVFKLVETSPRTLPKVTFLDFASRHQIDLYILLAVLVSLEFLAILIMVFLARYARAMAIFMLTCFCLILINEIRGGATNCGCLGAFSPPIWMMLTIDGLLLLGTLACAPKASMAGRLPGRWPLGAAATGIVLGVVVSFGIVIPAGKVSDAGIDPRAPEPQSPDPTVNPSPQALKGYWYADNIAGWVGKPWHEIDLFKYMPKWPAGLETGTRYVVFYSRTCEHCEEMFWNDLLEPQDPPVVAIEIPADKETLTADNAWEMPETECFLMNLPVGSDWIISSPLSMRIEDGKVACVKEGDHKECLEME